MHKTLSVALRLAAVAFAAQTVSAEIPEGYYTGLDGLKDRYLKDRLYEIVSDHSKNSYSGLFSQSFCYTDVRDDGTWWDMYSDIIRYVVDGWSGMNREHCLPKSWWGGDESSPAYTDLNHLYPSDGPANMAKSNYPLGEVVNGSETFDNGVVKVGPPVAGQGGGSGRVFEPADEYKGDFARTYFYMVTCYQNSTWRYTYMTQNNTYPTMQSWAVNLLLEWHREDPVSEKELDRNDEVYRLQYNRNPFIDYPDLVEFIWGDKMGIPYEAGELPPIGDGTLVTPENGSTIDFGDVAAGISVRKTLPVRGSLSENLSLVITGTDRSDFSIPVNTIQWSAVNGGGYDLTITFEPGSTGDKTANLVLFDGGIEGSGYVVHLRGTGHEMPDFDKVEVGDATEITSNGFTLNWQTPLRPDAVDYYVVNIREYDNGNVSEYTQETDGAETSLRFESDKTGLRYGCTVQSVRYGAMSPESDVVFVNTLSSVAGVEAEQPLTAIHADGGVQLLCAGRHTNVRVVDMTGRTVRIVAEVQNNDIVRLPAGAYLIYSDQSRRPLKVLVD